MLRESNAAEGKTAMTRREILEMAALRGMKGVSRLRKADLIRAMQEHEGNYPCFGTAEDSCDRTDCLWRKDCLGS
jgi:hypothetical protein